MKLEKIRSNLTISIAKVKNNAKYSTTYSFYSTEDPEILLEIIAKRFAVMYDTDVSVLVTIRGSNSKIIEFPYHDIDIIMIRQLILKFLTTKKLAVDIKESRYRLQLQNCSSSQLDSKIYTFNSLDTFDEVQQNIKNQLKKIKNQVLESNIIFSNANPSKTTHYVTLSLAGTKGRRKQPSKTFSVCIPNYSSKEIIELLRDENE